LADTAGVAVQNIEDPSNSRPKTGIPPAHVQLAGAGADGLYLSQHTVSRQWFAQLEDEGLSQPFQGFDPVLVLRAAFLRDDNEAGWGVANADGGAGLVAFLTARTAGAIGVDVALGQQLLVRQGGPGETSHSNSDE